MGKMKKAAFACLLMILAAAGYWYLTWQIIYIPYAKMPDGSFAKIFDGKNSERNILMARELDKRKIEFRYVDGDQITVPRYLDLTGRIKQLEQEAGVHLIELTNGSSSP
jgi:hypothetical protein